MFDSTTVMNFYDFYDTFGTFDLSLQTKLVKRSDSEATFPLDRTPYEGGEIL